MGPTKSPGPDGIQALFYQKNWALIAPSLLEMVHSALEGHGFPEALNDANIVVIPKVTSPEHIKQFRPIVLCNVAYKIITTVLVN